MKKSEFIEKIIKKGFDFDDELILFERDLDAVIQSAIEDHERSQWKPYPENKPENTEVDYLVQYEDSDCNEVAYIDEGFEWNTPSDGFYGEVIAFRKLPKPYEP